MAKITSFEEALKRLEKIVEEMESGDAELEKSIDNFEEGIKLVKLCSSKLEQAKKKIEILVEKDGKMISELFDSKEGLSASNEGNE